MPSLITRYRAKSTIKRIAAAPLGLIPTRKPGMTPSVTVVIPALKPSPQLRVTEATLRHCTRYTNYNLDLAIEDTPLHAVYDRYFRTATTEYWVAVHDDMLFLARDWLTDLIRAMERDPDLYLVACERAPARQGVRGPFGNVVDTGESLATWLFCVRSRLRERIDTSFAAYKDPRTNAKGRIRLYDIGGKLIAGMEEREIRWKVMPWWFQLKYQHIGNLSWGLTFDQPAEYRALKEYQLAEASRRAERGENRR